MSEDIKVFYTYNPEKIEEAVRLYNLFGARIVMRELQKEKGINQ